jgi:hypothetical protein
MGVSRLPNIIFDFSKEVIPAIIKEIGLAEKYIRISIFQMHNEALFKALSERLKQGLSVEILTLPYDSIKDDVRQEVEARFLALEKDGAKVYLDRWNVGAPERTTTAVDRWYSFHGKFIVTDRCAAALSANFIEDQELDAVIIYRDDERKIKEFNEKFDRLLSLFIKKDDDSDGQIRRIINEATKGNNDAIFDLPRRVDAKHRDHWIQHYPAEICLSDVPVEERLYITPFDCRGREFLTNVIKDAKFAYISTESFTDRHFSDYLVNLAENKNTEIKVLSGIKSMDFTDRVNDMLKSLLAQEIGIRTTAEDLHGKLVVTDTAVVVSSINLNNINLGFHLTKRYWRENTESILVCKDPGIAKLAAEKFLEIFNRSSDVRDELSGKIEVTVQEMFSKTFQLRSSSEVKNLFARFILKKQVEIKKLIIKIGRIAKKLMVSTRKNTVEKQDFFSALILYHLSERKHDYNELKEKLFEVDESIELEPVINALMFSGFIEKENGFFKIKVESLISA